MAAIIRIKRSTGTAAPGSLKTGELAYSAGTGTSANLGDRLFFGKGDDGSGNATSVVVIGGEYLADLLDHTPGTLTASSAIITDASNKIDVLNVDNITINGNIISSTDTNGNIVLDPNGIGLIDASNTRIINVTNPSNPQDAATKAYVDAANTAQILSIIGDTGSDTIDLDDSDLTISGGTGLTSVVTNNTITINLDNTAVTPASYGSATEVPILTIDQQGRITAASTATISTTLNTSAETGTGAVSLIDSSLEIAAGEGINTVASGNTITISGEDATTSNKGIASFDSDNFTVTSGNVAIKNGGVSNDELVNSSLTIGSTTIALGATSTTLAGLTQLDVDNVRIDGNTISTTSGTLFVDPNPVGDSGDFVILGNLIVQGTTTTINSTTVTINDLNIVLADSAADAIEANGAGITVNGANATITYNASNDDWVFNKGIQAPDFEGVYLGFDSDFGTKSTTDLTEGSNLYYTDERVDDRVANLLLAGEGIDLTYDDSANSLTIAAELATISNPGVANFDSDQFTVTSGLVSIFDIDGGTF